MAKKDKRARRSADAYAKTQKLTSREAADDPGSKKTDAPDADEELADAELAGAREDEAVFEKVGSPAGGEPAETPAPATAGVAIPPIGAGPGRVAGLLIALGPDRAAEVLERLDETEVEMVAQAIMRTPKIRSEDAARLLEAIGQTVDNRRLTGGPQVAREMLVRAFGEEKGERFFHDAVPNAAPGHFQFLDDLEPHQLRLLFREESAGAIAVVITHLDRTRAGEVLRTLSPERQTDVVRRVARMGRLNREVIVRIEEAVREKIRQQGHQVTQSVDGNEKLAAILRHMAPSEESEILQALEIVDPELTRSVKERLYTTDLLLLLGERELSDLLRDFGDIELALFMKGKTDEIRARVLRAVSERRRSAIAEEYAHLGSQKRSDVDAVTHELLERLRQLEEDGTILVPREGDRYI